MHVPRPQALIEALTRCAPWLLGAYLLACARGPEDRLVGWPPSEDVVPYGLPDAPAPAPPTVADSAEPEAAPVEVAPAPSPPCLALVEHACVLWTPFADACREARTKVPDDSHAPTREACAALLAKYQAETRWGNPCGRYTRALCKESGESSERCKAARARIALLTQRREWNACLADLIWFEARTLRR